MILSPMALLAGIAESQASGHKIFCHKIFLTLGASGRILVAILNTLFDYAWLRPQVRA